MKSFCWLGFHRWDGCKCVRCGRTKSKAALLWEHSYGDWIYIDSDSCKQVRVCIKCGHQTSERIYHEWGEWEPANLHSCKHSCNRCKTVEEEKHNYICNVCGGGGRVETGTEWVNSVFYDDTDCYTTRELVAVFSECSECNNGVLKKCSRCHEANPYNMK